MILSYFLLSVCAEINLEEVLAATTQALAWLCWKDFEVMTTPLDNDVLAGLHEKIASFIVNQVISVKGEFHCNNLGIDI
ncbi:hypothetical protein SETIT_8G096300v2 [Setaria italica]|uniref:Uncharacterized protein n=1 Tax=Setaria italica TaxID=4555 RepID=A0A368S661_SETIT|nr:hypothetical protein SETIT_8G096300v2 [Setaria italica]